MNNWQPGRPVLSADDDAAWRAWRADRKRQLQRERRATNPRIDYYPDKEAAALIRSMTGPSVGRDYSSVINRIVAEWADRCHRNFYTQEKGALPALPPE